MSEPVSIDTLEMVLNQQAEKDTRLRTDGEILINGDLLEDLKDLHAEKRRIIGAANGSMAQADTSDVDAQIAAKQAEAEQFIIRLHFKAVSSDEYLRVVARHPDASNSVDPTNTAPWNAFLGDLANVCYTGCTFRGQDFTRDQYPLAKFQANPVVGFGQLEPIYGDVISLNQRTPDRSFLSKP